MAPETPSSEGVAHAHRQLFELTAIPTIEIDLGIRQIIDINDAGLQLLGLDRADVIGRAGREFLQEASAEQVLRTRALRGDATRTVQNLLTSRGPRTCEINLVGIEGTTRAFCQVVDLTDLLEANTLLERQTRSLEKKTAALESVTTRVAHDLRSPLTAIAGFAGLLLRSGDELPSEKRQQMLERIEANARAVATSAADVVEQASSGEVSNRSTNTAGLLDSVRAVADIALIETGSTMSTSSSVQHMPRSIGEVHPILANLVDNAIKYRDPARPLHVSVAIDGVDGIVGGDVVIHVDDNGRGIPDDVESLFVAGYRAHDDEVIGTGLGLQFARAKARELGGDLTATPLEVGSRFTLTLSRAATDDDSSPIATGLGTGMRAADVEAAFDVSPVATVFVDLSGPRISRVNRAALDMLGRPLDEILGQPGSAVLADPAHAAEMRTAVMAVGHHTTNTSIIVPEGVQPVELRCSLIPDTTTAIVHLLAIDIAGAAPSAVDAEVLQPG